MNTTALSSPKNALHALYGNAPRNCQITDENYVTWNDGGPSHLLKWTSIFICPRMGEIFKAGRYYESSFSVESNDEGEDNVVWFSKRKLAEHGAAARAFDCLKYRDSLSSLPNTTIYSTPTDAARRLLRDDPPYPATLASSLPTSMPLSERERSEIKIQRYGGEEALAIATTASRTAINNMYSGESSGEDRGPERHSEQQTRYRMNGVGIFAMANALHNTNIPLDGANINLQEEEENIWSNTREAISRNSSNINKQHNPFLETESSARTSRQASQQRHQSNTELNVETALAEDEAIQQHHHSSESFDHRDKDDRSVVNSKFSEEDDHHGIRTDNNLFVDGLIAAHYHQGHQSHTELISETGLFEEEDSQQHHHNSKSYDHGDKGGRDVVNTPFSDNGNHQHGIHTDNNPFVNDLSATYFYQEPSYSVSSNLAQQTTPGSSSSIVDGIVRLLSESDGCDQFKDEGGQIATNHKANDIGGQFDDAEEIM